VNPSSPRALALGRPRAGALVARARSDVAARRQSSRKNDGSAIATLAPDRVACTMRAMSFGSSFFVRSLASSTVIALALAACSSEAESEDPPLALDAGDPVPSSPPARAGDEEPRAAVDAGADAPATCLDELRRAGIAFEPTVARGVVDAVVVTGPIGGISFTKEDSDVLTDDPMDCAFVLTLRRFAAYLQSQGVVKVGTLGSYCYRCCCAWSPTNDCRSPTDPEPDCSPNGYSNHSWGRAIDVRYLHFQSGVVYDIENPAEWVAGSAATTCTTGLAKQQAVSKILYGIACAVASQGIFDTILTPNYNDAHRNHWHLDIGTPDDQPPWSTTVRSMGHAPTPIDVASSLDVCGGD
jgi:hypothetical protein